MVTRCRGGPRHGTIQTMNNTIRRIRTAISDLVSEDRSGFKRIDASPARYDDGSWLEPRR
jgi:hypothetical protein